VESCPRSLKENIKTVEAFEMWVWRCMEKITRISCTEKITNLEVLMTLMRVGDSMGRVGMCPPWK